MKTRMERQGGWAANFVVIGIILVLGLVGGVYFLKNQSMDSKVSTVPEITTDSETKPQQATTEKDNATKDATDEKATAEPSINNSQPKPSTDDATVASPEAVLPNTGPSNLFMQAIILAGFTAVVAYYLGSRKTATQL